MDNTVGSLTQFQESVIIGTILGDGYLRIIPGRKNAFLEINHAFREKSYVDWKFKIFVKFFTFFTEPVAFFGNMRD